MGAAITSMGAAITSNCILFSQPKNPLHHFTLYSINDAED